MAGNSKRRGATTKGRGNTAGSGGRIRRSLEGKGPTPRAEDRPYHKAYKAKQANANRQRTTPTKKSAVSADWVIGRNPVLEVLQAGIPVRNTFIAEGAERDSRMKEILRYTAENSIPLAQITKNELDRMTGGAAHQSVAVQLPPYSYAEVDDIIGDALVDPDQAGLILVLDHITDPRNLGAIVRSAAAFGAHGIVIPDRRAASMTAAAWKTSAGAAVRMPIAQVGNLNKLLARLSKAGFGIIGLEGESEVDISTYPGLSEPLVVVVGSEESGIARLTRENCDELVSIPIAADTESLNASVAAAIALYEVSRVRGSLT